MQEKNMKNPIREQLDQDVMIVRNFAERERRARERAYEGDAAKVDEKTYEVDHALEALNRIAAQASRTVAEYVSCEAAPV